MAEPTSPKHEQGLDEVLLAMDVVDTLRHRDQMVLRELDNVGKEKQLIDRLREIYTAQGIEVPDHILRDGVKALEERRFSYTPPKTSLSVRLARLYVSRSRWLKPLGAGLAAITLGLLGYHYGVTKPAAAKAEAQRVELAEQAEARRVDLTETLPAKLEALRGAVQDAALDEDADRLAETYYQDGIAAAKAGKADTARSAIEDLTLLERDIKSAYEIRIVYGPNAERSGVFRIPDADPSARNYYLIVEAVDVAGRRLEVPVISEEDLSRQRTKRWGQRVSEAVFYAVAEDKSDDQIIQNAVIGMKPSGYYVPVYSVETPGGALLEW